MMFIFCFTAPVIILKAVDKTNISFFILMNKIKKDIILVSKYLRRLKAYLNSIIEYSFFSTFLLGVIHFLV